ncbi:hypothetical protein [Lacinutrix sp.]|uniref:hypothetical protein n=1 Tax=Lacinutrix sp. TaxID=1937692 RepID=UPI0030EF8745
MNRLEFDFGFRSNNNVDAIKLTGLYQWVWDIDEDFNWYAGLGGGFGSANFDTTPGPSCTESYLLAAGIIGI